jgi:ubiquitin-protein ligase
MLSPRIRRLKLDYELLQQRFAGWPVIRMVGSAGMPPELYRFQYLLRGLYVAADGSILERNEHLLEVNLTLGYPRRAPQCRMLTPVFHPNFDESSVCIGDFWAASESLDDLIVRIGRMIAYQEYNTKSPLNGLAAKWAAQNAHLLPVDSQPVAPPLAQTAVVAVGPNPTPITTVPASPRLAPEPTLDKEDPWEKKIVIP